MNKNTVWRATANTVVLAIFALMIFAGQGIGAVASIILWAIVRAVSGRSKDGGIIGVDHVDRPSSSTYGGGFTPGGIFGMSNTGTRFGVYGAPTAPARGPRREYIPEDDGRKMNKKTLIIVSISVSLLFVTSLNNLHAGTLVLSALLFCWLAVVVVRRWAGANSKRS